MKNIDKKTFFLGLSFFFFFSCSHLGLTRESSLGFKLPSGNKKQNSVIFFHPDGMSLSHWGLGRLITKGPDGLTSWDQMPHIAVYKPHLKKSLVPTSNAGAVAHAYGVKAALTSFGMIDGKAEAKNKTKRITILQEAQQKGFKTGLVQSGRLIEPGTAVFASRTKSRKAFHEITSQLVYSNVDILLAGGEKYLLSQGTAGHFGKGVRTDNRNLIQEAENQGYFVIYTLEGLKTIPKTARKVLGVFAHDNTYNDESREVLIQKGLEPYDETAPSIAEMSKYALEFLTRGSRPFFLVVEEEGTDNFSNKNNAEGLFAAIKRSLSALDLFRDFLKQNKNTLLIAASDSNASSPALISHFNSKKPFTKDQILPSKTKNGAPLDRKRNGRPFLSQPDQTGFQMPFAIAWPTKRDVGTGVVVKAEGRQAHKVKGVLDNTELYHIMRQVLFR